MSLWQWTQGKELLLVTKALTAANKSQEHKPFTTSSYRHNKLYVDTDLGSMWYTMLVFMELQGWAQIKGKDRKS